MYVSIGAFISIVLAMHVVVSDNWNRHTIKSISRSQDGSDRNV